MTKLLLDSYPAVVCQLCLGCQVADVPSENSWLPEDFSGEVEVIKYFQSSTRMKYLVNNVIFDRMLKSLHSTFLLVPLSAL